MSVFDRGNLYRIISITVYMVMAIYNLNNAFAQMPHESLVVRAEEALARGQLDFAIETYETALQTHLGQSNPDDAELGKLHSRIGQLYIKKMRTEPRPDFSLDYRAKAAFHYIKCTESKELSQMIKSSVCESQVKQLTAPLLTIGEAYSINVIHPEYFKGPVKNGHLLPKGLVSIEYQKKANSPIERQLIRIPMVNPLDFTEKNYMPPRPLLQNPVGLVLDQDGEKSSSYKTASTIPRLPGYILAGVGLIGLSTGAILQLSGVPNPMGKQGQDLIYLTSGISLGLGTGWLIWAW